jgi:hypothetical protein
MPDTLLSSSIISENCSVPPGFLQINLKPSFPLWTMETIAFSAQSKLAGNFVPNLHAAKKFAVNKVLRRTTATDKPCD